MWVEVQHFVVHIVRLPIGPLNDDEEARRDIALRVLQRLETDDFACVRDWLRRQQRETDSQSWWGFIKLLTKWRAIDYARTSLLNVSRRRSSFDWVRVVPADNNTLARLEEVLDRLDAARTVDLVNEGNGGRATPAARPTPRWSAAGTRSPGRPTTA